MKCRFCENKGKHWEGKICPPCQTLGKKKGDEIQKETTPPSESPQTLGVSVAENVASVDAFGGR